MNLSGNLDNVPPIQIYICICLSTLTLHSGYIPTAGKQHVRIESLNEKVSFPFPDLK